VSAARPQSLGRALAYGRFLAGLPRFLNTPIGYDAACATIRLRLERRHAHFLQMMRTCVYANPRSPYLPLLGAAGCELGDMAAHLARAPLEDLLARLAREGVRVSLDEYKGRLPIARRGLDYAVAASDFDNRVLRRGVDLSTGGSTGRPTRTLIDLDFLEDRACYEHVMFRMLELRDVPMAIWYPKVPSSIGLVNCLRYAKVGKAVERWFDMSLAGRSMGPWHGWALALTVAASRVSRTPLPRTISAPLQEPGPVIDWIAGALRRHGRSAVQSNVSGVLRLTRAASDRGADLTGVQFITGSEPLTPARRAEIVSSGARVYQRYYAVDLGSIAGGCGNDDSGDDLHLFSDTVTAVSYEPAADDGSVPLCLTSILGRGPKVILNVDLGDRAIVSQRRCGCLYDQLGLSAHLSCIRSSTRSTAEGAALPYAELIRVAEHVLPALLHASALDFQWLEGDDPADGGLTRLCLRIAPEAGEVDEAAVRAAILDAIGRRDDVFRFYARLFDAAGSLRIVRERPRTTLSGKMPAIITGGTIAATPPHRRRDA
jgi:hypothetical protein